MSHQAVAHVLSYSSSRLAARLVELVLASHARPDGTGAWPSVATIAREANLSERAVREALATLRAAGLIIDTGESPRRTRTYNVAHAAYPPKGADGAGVQTAQDADGAGLRVQTVPEDPARPAPKPSVEPFRNRTAPQPPALAGGDNLELPVRPTGNRRTDLAAYNKALAAYAAGLLRDDGVEGDELRLVKQALAVLEPPDRTPERVRAAAMKYATDRRADIRDVPALAAADCLQPGVPMSVDPRAMAVAA